MRILFTLLLALASFGCYAQADYAREQRWADEITPAILVGDPVQLALPAGRKFLGIYAPNSKAQAGVVVVHGLGVHPDWGLINPLRSQLAEQGYATLSVQMPVLAAELRADRYSPLLPEAAARIAVAVKFLQDKGHKKIAIVSYSFGSRMANVLLNQPDAPAIAAWVSIGIVGEYTKPETFKSPVLDLYGEKDFPEILELAAQRAAAIQKIRGSAQIRVAGADHFFNGMDKELVNTVKQFLDRATR
ncbi:MAG: alpha/beta hydrolase family protein [Burkholderiales bacterium]|jgi:predicted alpha/beta-fold hydrolase|nr:alpha/beta hydrolase family protein [Burkholderiales bacterium]